MDYNKLNIGSGYKKYDGFLNIDSDPKCNPDYIIDIDDVNLQFPFNNNSVSEVKVHHVLEHIGLGYFQLLKELYRVCKPHAIIDIVVPHHRHDFFHNDPTHKRPITIDGLKLFSKSYNQMCIDMGASATTLGMQYDVDFDVVDYDYKFNSMYFPLINKANEGDKEAQTLMTQIMSERNNVIEEVHIKLMVVKHNELLLSCI